MHARIQHPIPILCPINSFILLNAKKPRTVDRHNRRTQTSSRGYCLSKSKRNSKNIHYYFFFSSHSLTPYNFSIQCEFEPITLEQCVISDLENWSNQIKGKLSSSVLFVFVLDSFLECSTSRIDSEIVCFNRLRHQQRCHTTLVIQSKGSERERDRERGKVQQKNKLLPNRDEK